MSGIEEKNHLFPIITLAKIDEIRFQLCYKRATELALVEVRRKNQPLRIEKRTWRVL